MSSRCSFPKETLPSCYFGSRNLSEKFLHYNFLLIPIRIICIKVFYCLFNSSYASKTHFNTLICVTFLCPGMSVHESNKSTCIIRNIVLGQEKKTLTRLELVKRKILFKTVGWKNKYLTKLVDKKSFRVDIFYFLLNGGRTFSRLKIGNSKLFFV